MLALDFDGVVCDALGECAAVTWYAAKRETGPRPGPAAAVRHVPAPFLATFASARAYSRTLDDFMVANTVAPGATLDRATFERCRAQAGPTRLAAQARHGAAIRAQWRRCHPEEWIALHTVQPRVAGLIRATAEPVAIVSAKDAESILKILAAAGLDRRVSRIVGSCSDKAAALDELAHDAQRRSAGERVLFVDDNFDNAVAAARIPGVESRWANWGYHGPEHDRAAAAAGIAPLLLDQLGGLVRAPANPHPPTISKRHTERTLMTSNVVLFALTSHDKLGDTGRSTGAYAPEIAHPAQVFADAGWEIEFVSVAGGQPPLDGVKPEDRVTQAFLQDPEVIAKLAATRTAAELDPADYAVIYFAGGHGTMWDFPTASELNALGARIYEQGGVVAAVCHGPAALLGITLRDGAPIVAGRRVSSFTNDEESAVGLIDVVPFRLESELVKQGASHAKAANFAEHAVADGRLVTGQNPASAAEVARLALALTATTVG